MDIRNYKLDVESIGMLAIRKSDVIRKGAGKMREMCPQRSTECVRILRWTNSPKKEPSKWFVKFIAMFRNLYL